ncbi:MAG: hypothetical protein HOP19_08890 [Acidobacteria bacterium]|nr:hypothetical protein [Acidobacteriota bacterium]
MLRITETTTNEAQTLLQLEGRLVGQWVALLRESGESLEANAFALELTGVSFVDHAGLELLHSWQTRGIKLLNCPLFLQEMLRQAALAKTNFATPPMSVAS